MLISRDPDGKPSPPLEFFELAERYRMHVINVICDEPGAKVGDNTGVSFMAMAPFLPRMGDRLQLEDGSACEVRRSHYKVVTQRDPSGKAEAITLMPNVFAVRISKPEED